MEENKIVTQEQQDVQPFATWMDQAIYDKNGNGIVDDAEKLNGREESGLSVASAVTATKLNGKTESELVVSYAMNAGSATNAAYATEASSAATAGYATSAGNANTAASATIATTAQNALKLGDKAESALEVASAQTAANADYAMDAGNAATLGGKAEGDLEVASAQTAASADYATDAGNAEKLGNKTLAEIVSAIYPIGSIYMSVATTDPGTLFGGTWQRWGEGRVPVGVDEADTDFMPNAGTEKTGGGKQVWLEYKHLPQHAVRLLNKASAEAFDGAPYQKISAAGWNLFTAQAAGNGNYAQPMNNLQPYITCYMWKRVG